MIFPIKATATLRWCLSFKPREVGSPTADNTMNMYFKPYESLLKPLKILNIVIRNLTKSIAHKMIKNVNLTACSVCVLTAVVGIVCHAGWSVCQTVLSLPLFFSSYNTIKVFLVALLLLHAFIKKIKSQSALSTFCSLQLLLSWNSWPWWPSVTLQFLSAWKGKSPTKLHLQVTDL